MLQTLLSLRNILIVILTPVVLLPLILVVDGQQSSCAYVMLIMAIFWLTDALPLNITALLPIFMFPMVGVLSADDIAGVFLNSTSLMFLGSMMVAVAIEEWNIHKRIALKVLIILGAEPVWLMLGLMLTAWFLSMWTANTATTAMMLPIAIAIINNLKNDEKNKGETTDDAHVTCVEIGENNDNAIDIELTVRHDNHTEQAVVKQDGDVQETEIATEIKDKKEDDKWVNMNKALTLCIAYSASIGGTGSMTGSTPNLVLKGQLDKVYEKLGKECPLTFGTWLAFGVPTSFVIIILSWLWLQFYFLRCSGWSKCCRSRRDESNLTQILEEQYRKLGTISFGQVAVLAHLVAMALLWVTLDKGGTYGWSRLFKDKFIEDSVPALLVGCSLFIFPSAIPKLFRSCSRGTGKPTSIQPLLNWKKFNEKMPWGVIILLGGGFAMAKAAQKSGLSIWIGTKLDSLNHLQPWILNLVICIIVAMMTEVTSNTATTALLLPILADMTTNMGMEPLYLMLPTTFAASFAFMLPVATPPNAVVFSFGYVKVLDMVKAGAMLNVIAVLVLLAANESIGRLLFRYG